MFSERGVGGRRTPRERSSRPPAALLRRNFTPNSSPRRTTRARARRPSRRSTRPRRRARRSRARCRQPRRHSRVFRTRRRLPPHAARALLAPASRPSRGQCHLDLALEPAHLHAHPSLQIESTKRAASPPLTSTPSAPSATALALSRSSSTASAAAARHVSALAPVRRPSQRRHVTSNPSPRSSIRARTRRPSRRISRPRRRTRRSRARCPQPRQHSHVFRTRRRLPPHAVRALLAPVRHPRSSETPPRTRSCATSPAPEPADRADEARGLAAARASAERAVRSRTDVFALVERGVGRRRMPRQCPSRLPTAPRRQSSPRPRARAAPTAPEPAGRIDAPRSLAAACVDAKRAVLSRADALALFARGVGCRRTPLERSSRPPAALAAAIRHFRLEPAQHHPRPNPQTEPTKRAASPPRASTPSALLTAAPTFSRPSSAASAAAARRSSAPRACQSPLLRPLAPRPRARATPLAPEPAARIDEARGPAAARVDTDRAVCSNADALAPSEHNAGRHRTPRERSSLPPAALQ